MTITDSETTCRCVRCGSTYLVPVSFSETLEQQRMLRWLAEHDCKATELEL